MDSFRFDALARSFSSTASRRAALRGLTAAISLGVIGLAGVGDGEARKRCKKSCGKCKRCQQGRCKPRPDGTTCGSGKVCAGGSCGLCTAGGGVCDLFNPGTCCSQRCCNVGVGGCGAAPCCC